LFLEEFSPYALQRVPTPTERLMGLMLIHDITPSPLAGFSPAVFGAWKAADRFGIVDAAFLPYWEPNGVTTDNKDFIASVYQKPGKSLLVVLNSGKEDGQTSVKVDPKRLGLGTGWTAKDAFDDSSLPVTDQTVKLSIPGRGYRMVVLQ